MLMKQMLKKDRSYLLKWDSVDRLLAINILPVVDTALNSLSLETSNLNVTQLYEQFQS